MPTDDDKTDGQRLAARLAALSSGSFAGAPTDTDVDALPTGAKEFPIRERVRDRQGSAELERVRDLVMPDVNSLDTIRQGTLPPVDVNATILTKQDAQPAQLLRDRALDVRRDMDQLETIRRPSGSERPRPVDVNATIVTQHARTVAEQERDLAFEKLRDGTADELRSAPRTRASTGPEAPAQAVRHTTADGLPLLKTSPTEIRGVRTRPDEDSGITARATGNEMRGTIDRRGTDGERGGEPDGSGIGAEERDEPVSRPWWQRWQYLAPLGALAVTAGVALVVVEGSDFALRVPRDPSATEQPARESVDDEPPEKVWLDGQSFDLDQIDPAALDEIAPDPAGAEEDHDANAVSGDGILPAIDYGLDTLDDDQLTRAESWLARALT